MKFANIFLDMKYMLMQEINNELNTDLIEDCYSLHGMSTDWIGAEVEIDGFDKFKGEEFVLTYNYQSKVGRIHYLNGEIKQISTLK